MSRNNRHDWRDRQNKTQRVQPHEVAGAVRLDTNQREQQEALVKARVENLAAAIYAQNIGGAVDDKGRFDIDTAGAVASFSIDSALIFAKEVWGIHGQRVCNPAPQFPVVGVQEADGGDPAETQDAQ